MGRAPCCDKANVKKGPWSPEEDARLKSYIHQHGTGGNWIALPQKIGLKRCGKSCRLRWLNYLRPNIKHGGFSEEEDNIICSLYVTIGSRWSIIAAQLPGRTDNDIKNYWNTRLKKKLLGKQRHHHHRPTTTRNSHPPADHNTTNPPPPPPPPMVLEFPAPDHHDTTTMMMMMMMMMDHDQAIMAPHQQWQLGAPLAGDHDEEFNLGEMVAKLHAQNQGGYNYDHQVAVSPNYSSTSSTTGPLTNNPSTSSSSSLMFHAGLQEMEMDATTFPLGLGQPDGSDQLLLITNPLDGFEGWYGNYPMGNGGGATSSQSTAATTSTWGNNAGYEMRQGGFQHQLPPMEDSSSIYFSLPQ